MLSFNVSLRSRSNKVQIDLTVTRIHSDVAMGKGLNVLHNYYYTIRRSKATGNTNVTFLSVRAQSQN